MMKPSVAKEMKAVRDAGKRSHTAIGRAMVAAGKRFKLNIDVGSMAVATIGNTAIAHAAPRNKSDDVFTSLVAFTKKVKAAPIDLELPSGIYQFKWRPAGHVECYDLSGACLNEVPCHKEERSSNATEALIVRPRLSASIDWEKVCADIVWGHIGLSACWYW